MAPTPLRLIKIQIDKCNCKTLLQLVWRRVFGVTLSIKYFRTYERTWLVIRLWVVTLSPWAESKGPQLRSDWLNFRLLKSTRLVADSKGFFNVINKLGFDSAQPDKASNEPCKLQTDYCQLWLPTSFSPESNTPPAIGIRISACRPISSIAWWSTRRFRWTKRSAWLS